MIARTARIWLIPVVGLACQQPPDLTDDIRQYAELTNDVGAATCDCHQDAGFDTLAECSDALGHVGPEERECIADALAGHEDAGKDFLSCVNGARSSQLTCLEQNISCEPGMIAVCADEYAAELSECSSLPDSVRERVDACVL